MADVHNEERRSYNMSQIKAKNTKPELLVRKFLHAAGFRYRLHKRDLPGTPDMVLSRIKTVVFVHGCFWHGHMHCKYSVIPKTRTKWWTDKINNNIAKDKKAEQALNQLGWKTIIIWECQLRKESRAATLEELGDWLRGQEH